MRLFVTILLPKAIKDRLKPLCSGVPGAKWADPDQMHITLNFIGEVDGIVARDLGDALSGVHAEPFDVELATIGHFATGHRLRTLWVGVAESAALSHLQASVAQSVRSVTGQAESRKFHAHVTLARFKRTTPDLGGYLAQHEPFRASPIPVTEFMLFSSHLGSERAIHTLEARYPLSA